MIREGCTFEEIEDKWPEYSSKAMVLFENHRQRHKRRFTRQMIYIWGPPGTGKSTIVMDLCNAIQKAYGYQTFNKGIGLSKWYDGYNYEDIIWIDDPALSFSDNTDKRVEAAMSFKNILSVTASTQEVKFSHKTVDVSLMILTCNVSPDDVIGCFDEGDKDALKRRLTKTVLYLDSNEDKEEMDINRGKLRRNLCKYVAAQLDIAHKPKRHAWEKIYEEMDKDFTDIPSDNELGIEY